MPGMSLTGAAAFTSGVDAVVDSWGNGGTWVVGTPTEYAIHQEFGTAYQSGTPHVRPAARAANQRLDKLAEVANSMDSLLMAIAFYLEGVIKRLAPVDTGQLRASYAAQKLSD